MSANIIIDETQCGALCQHPTCWYSGRRLVRGTPHTVVKEKGAPDLNTDESYTSKYTHNLLCLIDVLVTVCILSTNFTENALRFSCSNHPLTM